MRKLRLSMLLGLVFLLLLQETLTLGNIIETQVDTRKPSAGLSSRKDLGDHFVLLCNLSCVT